MQQLTAQTVADLDDRVSVPPTTARRSPPGIVHFGVGGFHRAHQAMYLDRLMNAGKALRLGHLRRRACCRPTGGCSDVLRRPGRPLHAGGQAPRRHAASRG